MKVLLDTCMILDALQTREPFAADAQTIFLLAANERITACMTAKSVTDIYYLTHKLTHSDKETRKILEKLFSLFQVLDTTASDCLHALPSAVSDYEDALMVETAKRVGADCIVTRNLRDYRSAEFPVLSPQEFLRRIESEDG